MIPLCWSVNRITSTREGRRFTQQHYAATANSETKQCSVDSKLNRSCDPELWPFCPKNGMSVTHAKKSISTKFEVSVSFHSGLARTAKRDKPTNRRTWYYVWWPWLTSKRVARVCHRQLRHSEIRSPIGRLGGLVIFLRCFQELPAVVQSYKQNTDSIIR